jgi:type IV pilus assembly protein PilW
MVGLTIGLIILTALLLLFSNISYSNKEQFKAAQQLENGRYAMELLSNDIRLAGFYGEFASLPAAMSALPDPCDETLYPEGDVTSTTTTSPLAFYLQTYVASTLAATPTIPTKCSSWIDNASLALGSDIIIVRRLNTSSLISPPDILTATAASGQAYTQTNPSLLNIQYGTGSSINTTMNARGELITDDSFKRKDFSQPVDVSSSLRPKISASIRSLVVHIYYVAKCRTGTGTNGKCRSTDDNIPTLKAIELSNFGSSPAMSVTPLVEGIEFLKIRLGIDTNKDGQMEGDLVKQPANIEEWQDIVQVEIRLLARNSEKSLENDTKSYDLGGGLTFVPSGTERPYKRHAYSQQVYITNIAGRREL